MPLRPLQAVVALSIAAFAPLSCQSDPSAGTGRASLDLGPAPPCPDATDPKPIGRIASEAVVEASGLAASARHSGVFYVVNDSGDGPNVYAIDSTGRDMGRWTLLGARAVDWEEVAVGACDEGSCIYVADVGDNLRRRGHYAIYRAAEPETTQAGAVGTLPFERFEFVYPDGRHDTEAMIIESPDDVLLITKESGTAGLYRVRLVRNAPDDRLADRVGDIVLRSPRERITAASGTAADGALLVRTLERLYRFDVSPGETAVAALMRTPCLLPVANERQGEAVAKLPGDGYVTTSEGRHPLLFGASCAIAPRHRDIDVAPR